MNVIYVFIGESLREKHLFKILKPCLETCKCFEERLRGGKVVKNLENVLIISDKTNIELDFCMQILKAAIHLDLHNYSHHSQPLSKFG